MIKKLKLFGQDWKIFYHNSPPYLGTEYRGMTCFQPREIHLQTGQTERSTMLHELIHVAEEMTGANLTEAQVVSLERGLWMIFEANPQLLDYFKYGNVTNERITRALIEAGTGASAGGSGSEVPLRSEEVWSTRIV